jgi:hypothetical protein
LWRLNNDRYDAKDLTILADSPTRCLYLLALIDVSKHPQISPVLTAILTQRHEGTKRRSLAWCLGGFV